MINRISTAHMKEEQPEGKYYENQKEQAQFVGSLISLIPRAALFLPFPQLQECRPTAFVLSAPPCQPAPAAFRSCPERHLQCPELPAPCWELPARVCGSMGQDGWRAGEL